MLVTIYLLASACIARRQSLGRAMQLRVLWEDMQRFRFVEVVGEAERVQSSFVH